MIYKKVFRSLYIVLPILLLSLTIISCDSSEDVIDEVENPVKEEEEKKEVVEEDSSVVNSKIVWQNWYLSVPIERDDTGKATSIYYIDILANNFTDEESEYFYLNEDSSYTMYTKFTGYTTSGYSELNDKYCRTELREYWRGVQKTSDNWSMSTGTHVLESTLRVEYCEGNGQTYVAQIHGIETEGLEGSPATVKVQWYEGDIVIEYYVKPSGDDPWTSKYDEKINIGSVENEEFTIKIKIEEGKLFYSLVSESNKLDIDYTLVYDYVSNGYGHDNYFKTGNYFKHNSDYTKTSQVILYEVVTIHED